jgi:phosphoglucomutase
MKMTSESLETLSRRWFSWDKDPTTLAEIKSLCEEQAQGGPPASVARNELETRLVNRIQFGTAGLRGRMQAGFSFMNCLTVIQTSQGIAQYLVASSKNARPLSVIIGYDTRHNSARFARLAANAFSASDIKVLMFEEYVPTPFVAFAVKRLRASGGVMITASHNPAQDNGYKVYQSNGAQINTPVDQQIAVSILQNLEPWSGAWDESDISRLGRELLSDVWQKYCSQLHVRLRMVSNPVNDPGHSDIFRTTGMIRQ